MSNYVNNNILIGDYQEAIKLVGQELPNQSAFSNEENEYQVMGTVKLKKVSNINNLVN